MKTHFPQKGGAILLLLVLTGCASYPVRSTLRVDLDGLPGGTALAETLTRAHRNSWFCPKDQEQPDPKGGIYAEDGYDRRQGYHSRTRVVVFSPCINH